MFGSKKKGKEKQAPKKRDWEQELEQADDEVPAEATPSAAFLKLQQELEEKEAIQKQNEDREKASKDKVDTELMERHQQEKRRVETMRLPVVFFDIEIAENSSNARLAKGQEAGRITMQLWADRVPKTAENFRALCTGEKGRGEAGFPLSYLNGIFHRIVPGFMAQGGDITREDGTGGESIYGVTFPDEDLSGRHRCAGMLSMANSGRNTNSSQFFLTLGEAPWLDGKHVVFGRVLSGLEVLKKIDQCGSSDGNPKKRVIIADCGEVKEGAEGAEGLTASAAERSGLKRKRREKNSEDTDAAAVEAT